MFRRLIAEKIHEEKILILLVALIAWYRDMIIFAFLQINAMVCISVVPLNISGSIMDVFCCLNNYIRVL